MASGVSNRLVNNSVCLSEIPPQPLQTTMLSPVVSLPDSGSTDQRRSAHIMQSAHARALLIQSLDLHGARGIEQQHLKPATQSDELPDNPSTSSFASAWETRIKQTPVEDEHTLFATLLALPASMKEQIAQSDACYEALIAFCGKLPHKMGDYFVRMYTELFSPDKLQKLLAAMSQKAQQHAGAREQYLAVLKATAKVAFYQSKRDHLMVCAELIKQEKSLEAPSAVAGPSRQAQPAPRVTSFINLLTDEKIDDASDGQAPIRKSPTPVVDPRFTLSDYPRDPRLFRLEPLEKTLPKTLDQPPGGGLATGNGSEDSLIHFAQKTVSPPLLVSNDSGSFDAYPFGQIDAFLNI